MLEELRDLEPLRVVVAEFIDGIRLRSVDGSAQAGSSSDSGA